MSSRRGFAYQLEPVLATRRWALDAYRAQLGELTRQIVDQQLKMDQLQQSRESLSAVARSSGTAGAHTGADAFVRMHAYGAALAARLEECGAGLTRLERQHADLVDQVHKAQRALEAVEEHRDGALAKHVQAGMSKEFARADDQWNSLQWKGQ